MLRQTFRGPSAASLSGLVLVCMVLAVASTVRTLQFWLARDDYIRTDLMITDIVGDEENSVVGIVAATGEEVQCLLPAELYVYDSPRDPIGVAISAAAARGKSIPIWFAEDHHSHFSSPRVQFVSDHPALPTGAMVLRTLAVNLAVIAVGAWCLFFGIRLLRARLNRGA